MYRVGLLKNFAATSTLPGLGKIASKDNPLAVRIFWALLGIFGTFFSVSHVQSIVTDYLKYQTKVSITILDASNTADGAIFPAVSVMATRGLSKDGLSRLSSEMQKKLYFDNTTKTVDQATVARSLSQNIVQPFLTATSTLAHLPLERKREIVIKREDFIKSCSFEWTHNCSENFNETMNAAFGNVFTFNLAGQHGEAQRTASVGAYTGLKMMMFLDTEHYAASPSNNRDFVAGARVMVHSPYYLPVEIVDKTTKMPVGKKTTVTLRLLETSLERPPYETQCLDDEKDATIAVVKDDNLQLGQRYSFATCMMTCQRKHQWLDSGCAWWQMEHNVNVSMNWPPFRDIPNETKKATCDYSNEQQRDAFMAAWWKKRSGELQCDCPKRCNDHRFITARSTSDIEVKDSSMFDIVRQRHVAWSNFTDEQILKRTIELEVYYESLDIDRIVHTPAKNTDNLMSEIGGVIGLFIGLSLLSLGEVVELVGLVLAGLIRRVLGVGDLKGGSREALQRRRITVISTDGTRSLSR